jgi:hypothetical protein
MITDAILTFFLSIATAAWALVPAWTWSLPTDAINGLVSEITRWNGIAPVSELMTICGISGTLFVATVTFKVVVKIVDWIRG